jgi:hypothetical protein
MMRRATAFSSLVARRTATRDNDAMNSSEEEIQEQLQANLPEVAQGQVWTNTHNDALYSYPRKIRIICRYPFAQPADGRLWVVEKHPGSLGKIYRIPELSLRLLYDLAEEAPEL